MSIQINWLGHASFRLSNGRAVVYIDPWKLENTPQDADVALVSHSHYDHYSAEDVQKVTKADTQLIASEDVIAVHGSGQAISPPTIPLAIMAINPACGAGSSAPPRPPGV